MKYCKLRIAWSVVCGSLVVLLIVVWVRSLRVSDLIFIRSSTGATTTFCSSSGEVWFRHGADPFQIQMKGRKIPAHGWQYMRMDTGNADGKRFAFRFDSASALKIQVPIALPLVLLIGMALLPWYFRNHFSLRTLLIATTLVAIVLGLIMAVL